MEEHTSSGELEGNYLREGLGSVKELIYQSIPTVSMRIIVVNEITLKNGNCIAQGFQLPFLPLCFGDVD